jgi:hypothetical protein
VLDVLRHYSVDVLNPLDILDVLGDTGFGVLEFTTNLKSDLQVFVTICKFVTESKKILSDVVDVLEKVF